MSWVKHGHSFTCDEACQSFALCTLNSENLWVGSCKGLGKKQVSVRPHFEPNFRHFISHPSTQFMQLIGMFVTTGVVLKHSFAAQLQAQPTLQRCRLRHLFSLGVCQQLLTVRSINSAMSWVKHGHSFTCDEACQSFALLDQVAGFHHLRAFSTTGLIEL